MEFYVHNYNGEGILSEGCLLRPIAEKKEWLQSNEYFPFPF